MNRGVEGFSYQSSQPGVLVISALMKSPWSTLIEVAHAHPVDGYATSPGGPVGRSADLLGQPRLQARVDGAGVVLLDVGQGIGGQAGVLDVPAGVVEVMTGAGVDIPDRTDHLGC